MAQVVLQDDPDSQLWLFPNYAVVGICIVWFGIWFLLLALLPSGLKTTRTANAADVEEAAQCSSTEEPSTSDAEAGKSIDFYVRKLRRMQCYCVISSIAGVVLFTETFFHEEPLTQMLNSFGPIHQVLFTMAIAHWVINMWEDWETRGFLGQGLKGDEGGGMALFPLNLCCSPSGVMLTMFFVHHSFAAIVYTYSLATHELGGVMVQGFLYELPVNFMLRRELAHAGKETPGWLRSKIGVNTHWFLQYGTFLLGRSPATCLWLVSIVPGYGSERLSRMGFGTMTLFIYHSMAIFFTVLNIRIVGLYAVWHMEDDAMALKWEKAKQGAKEVATPSSIGSTSSAQNEASLEM